MASNKQKKRSEGPFLVVTGSSTILANVAEGQTINYVTFYRTRAALEQHLAKQKSATTPFWVFEGLSTITFEHTMKSQAFNVVA